MTDWADDRFRTHRQLYRPHSVERSGGHGRLRYKRLAHRGLGNTFRPSSVLRRVRRRMASSPVAVATPADAAHGRPHRRSIARSRPRVSGMPRTGRRAEPGSQVKRALPVASDWLTVTRGRRVFHLEKAEWQAARTPIVTRVAEPPRWCSFRANGRVGRVVAPC